MKTPEYVHQNNSDHTESERLRKLEALFDPRSQAFIKKIGLRKGHSVLEAGAGRGGLLPWLWETVGSRGHVTAVDLKTRFIDHIQQPNLEVLEGDLTEMDLGKEKYDLIHERYVLTHIADYRDVLKKMLSALKPGGWLLLEDADFSVAEFQTPDPQLGKAFHATIQARNLLFGKKRIDFAFGRHLVKLLSQFGFMNIQEEAYAPLDHGGDGTAEIMRLSTLQLWNQYLETEAATQEDLQTFVNIAGDPGQAAVYYSTISAWGQKPKP
jgi:ubiquinone/menaquinone biosynthesis C-methylase UbiE